MGAELYGCQVEELCRGDQPLPVDVTLKMMFNDAAGGRHDYAQDIMPADDFDVNLRDCFRELADLSIAGSGLPFREYGMFIFEFADGSRVKQAFTSDAADYIDSDANFEAIGKSGILDFIDTGIIPKRIIHIHTHPGQEYKPAGKEDCPVWINDGDYVSYQRLAAYFSHYAGRDLALEGWVLPVGAHCGDTVFCTEAQRASGDRGMEDRADADFHRRNTDNRTAPFTAS